MEAGALRSVKGKALDDRAGCAVLVEVLRHDYAFDLYAVFTAQEEVGLRGARVAAQAIGPDVAIALEGTICDDLPKKEDLSHVTELGKGPAITFMDRSFIADRRLVELLVRTAEAEGLPYQFKKAPRAAPTRAPFTWPARACPPSPSRCPAATSMRPRAS